jgi:putative ABC transport system permease protein
MKGATLAGREAIASLRSRPGRAIIAAIGTCMGVAAIVISYGLTSTSQGKVEERFQSLASNVVTVSAPASQGSSLGLPLNSAMIVDRLDGVSASSLEWNVPLSAMGVTKLPSSGLLSASTNIQAVAGTRSLLKIVGAQYVETPPVTLQNRSVIMGSLAATALGIGPSKFPELVEIDGVPFSVSGIFNSVAIQPNLLNSVVINPSIALSLWGAPVDGASVVISTQPGSSSLIAREAPISISPQNPQNLVTSGGSAPLLLQNQVSGDISQLITLVGLVIMLIGLLEICAISLMSVQERKAEIGLRRSIGASRSSIGLMFIVESGLLGVMGGLGGLCIGVTANEAVARFHQEPALLPLGVILIAPLVGFAAGLIGGLIPSLRASRLDPALAVRG